MTEQESPTEQRKAGNPVILGLAAVVVLVVAAAAGVWLAPMLRGSKPAATAPAAAPAPAPAPAATAAPTPAAPATNIEASRDTKPRPKKKSEPPAPAAAPAPAAPTAGELHIDSDVPGAMVFIDRKFIGNTPVTAKDVAPGRHQLNATAEGFDGYAEPLEVAVGPADVMIRFREIRLKESVDVVHKHGMGSCEGRLLADPQGIRYETPDKDDAFSLRFGEIEAFEVDYLKKNLRIKKRGGKQYNFTTKAPNADPLFVFHRNVDKVRQQVAGPAVKK
jgi:hypothetical protein